MTVHDDIDNLLAANLHGELSDTERGELQNHLIDCASCRQAFQETKIMNELLEEELEKPDAAFEQRVLANFRERVPEKSRSVIQLLVGLMRLRSAQIAAVAAVLLALVQVGKMVTGDSSSNRRASHASATTQPLGLSQDYGDRLAAYRQAAAEVDVLNKMVAAPALDPEAKAQKAKERDEKVENLKKMERELQNVAGIGGLDRSEVAPPPPQPSEGQPESHEEPSQRTKMSQSEASAEGRSIQKYAVSSAPEESSAKGEQNLAGEEAGPNPTLSLHRDLVTEPNPALANRKLIRNARIDLEIISFEEAVTKISAFANEARGYVATSGSQKQANGKLRGELVVKVLPENLDSFLQKIRGLGELKNQTLGTEDVTKQYFDTDARLKNAHVMEQRLIDMLKTKTGKVSDLLQVEKELGRVREEIEKMQGELKYWDSQVQFATVTISLAEKDLEEPAKFLLKERAQLSLYTPEVKKVYNEIKELASPKVQITNAQLERDNIGRVSARASLLIAPEESDGIVAKVKSLGRVENFQVQTERVAQGGEGMSENARTKPDKVELNISLSRDEQEQSLQQTSLQIRTSAVDEKAKALRDLAEKQNGRVLASSFSRDADGREFANVTLRVPMKRYLTLMQSLDLLGKVENVTVQRQDRTGGDVDVNNAPADVSIQVYNPGNIVSSESGLFATLRRTIGQSAGAIMWSVQMIGVAIAFLAPWVAALIGIVWITRRIRRRRR